jgi:PBP1b-binding outer membrane lipoprotein LpoB
MTRGLLKAVTGGAILALALVITGCSDSKKGEPKANKDAPKIQTKAAGGPGAPKGASD